MLEHPELLEAAARFRHRDDLARAHRIAVVRSARTPSRWRIVAADRLRAMAARIDPGAPLETIESAR